MDHVPWTRKYCPLTEKDVQGNQSAMAEIKDFIVDFKTQKTRSLLLTGPPGSGKTCMVYAICRDLGVEILEVNASDTRNADSIQSVVGSASRQMSLFSKGKVILVDEIDGLAGQEDRGGVAAIVAIIEKTGFPIILVANDPYDPKFSQLRSISRIVKLSTPSYLSVHAMLKRVAGHECLTVDDESLKKLARRAGGDFRAGINDLQSLAGEGGTIKDADIDAIDDRNRVETIINTLTRIFKTTQFDIAAGALDEIDEDIDKVILWIEENIAHEYESTQDIARAYEALSLADLYRGRILKRQHWRFLSYVNMYLTVGIALAKTEKYHKFVSYKPSTRILKLWRVSQRNKKRKEIAGKIAQKTHASARTVIQDTLPYLTYMLRHAENSKPALADAAGISSEDVDWLSK